MSEQQKPRATIDCPACGAVATDITPLKNTNRSIAVFACSGCGKAFKENGGLFVETKEQLRDVFRGATLGNEKLAELMRGETMTPETKAVLIAKLLEYGLQMWFDGLRQGLLMNAVQERKQEEQNGKGGSQQTGAAPGSQAPGSGAHAAAPGGHNP